MKVVFDTDPGIDDAMALLYLAGSDRLELTGITTITGNASLEQCTRNTLYLCETFHIDAPVYPGADGDVEGTTRTEFPDFVHGSNGLAGIDVTSSLQAEPESAADYLCRVTAENPGAITIIAVGQLTNIALALQQDPEFAGNVRDLVIMGGACRCEGNVSQWAEANIAGDPRAASMVFASGIPLTLVGLDVTMATCMDHDYIERICTSSPVLAPFLRQVTRVYGDYYQKEQDLSAFPVHDSSAVACAEHPEYFTMERGLLDCVESGAERGRTRFQPDLAGPHKVCLGVDSAALLARYHEVMTSHFADGGTGS